MELMDKVRQVGENYELNKYKSLNKTIELDARLANDRLLATKLRLSQVSSMNDKLAKELHHLKQEFRVQERKLLLTETMLRQLIDSRNSLDAKQPTGAKPDSKGSRLGRLRGSTRPRRQLAAAAGALEPSAQEWAPREPGAGRCRQVSSSGTQTQAANGRTKTIISDLRQRLNLVGSSKG